MEKQDRENEECLWKVMHTHLCIQERSAELVVVLHPPNTGPSDMNARIPQEPQCVRFRAKVALNHVTQRKPEE